jgi:hypothetical protein
MAVEKIYITTDSISRTNKRGRSSLSAIRSSEYRVVFGYSTGTRIPTLITMERQESDFVNRNINGQQISDVQQPP